MTTEIEPLSQAGDRVQIAADNFRGAYLTLAKRIAESGDHTTIAFLGDFAAKSLALNEAERDYRQLLFSLVEAQRLDLAELVAKRA
jgi:hypothetical protein